MSLIDESGFRFITGESCDDELHAFREVIRRILEIIGDCRIHLHRRLDGRVIIRSTHDIREPEGIVMDSEFLVGSIEELVSKNRDEVGDGSLAIIEKGCDIDCSLEIDIIGEITDLLVPIDIDHFTRE